jgi:hypothetical protein
MGARTRFARPFFGLSRKCYCYSTTPTGGVYGTAYYHSFSAEGSAPISYSLSAGSLPPGLELSSDGTISGVLAGALATDATASSPLGEYAIIQGTLAAPNYNIDFTGALLTVTPAILTVTADAKAMVYGADLPELTFQPTGFVNDEDKSRRQKHHYRRARHECRRRQPGRRVRYYCCYQNRRKRCRLR